MHMRVSVTAAAAQRSTSLAETRSSSPHNALHSPSRIIRRLPGRGAPQIRHKRQMISWSARAAPMISWSARAAQMISWPAPAAQMISWPARAALHYRAARAVRHNGGQMKTGPQSARSEDGLHTITGASRAKRQKISWPVRAARHIEVGK